jgi:hypothetical protein
VDGPPTEFNIQIARLVALTREKLGGDLDGLPCVGWKAGKKDAACLSRFSERVEARRDVGEEFGYHFFGEMGERFKGL